MVLAESPAAANVVFLVEGTANLSPYVESLKVNYITPTLEFFNGGPISPETESINISDSTLYGLVVFMSADYAMEPITSCYAPTASPHRFLSWLEKVLFIGGCAEAYSHIAEGLSTALQVFDDLQALRDPSMTVQKHCILVCNSSCYLMPALESPAYSGFTTDQLAGVIAERHINFSILSPRKIPMLYRLFEKAGGDLQLALSKNYAKDKRHLVLLKGYQLQERPMSPPLIDSKAAEMTVRSASPTTGQKRPASPSNVRDNIAFKKPPPTGQAQSVALPGANTQSPLGFGQPAQAATLMQSRTNLSVLNQPNPPNVTITNKASQQQLIPGDGMHKPRDQSPIPVGLNWTQPSSPSSTPGAPSVLASQLCPEQRPPLRATPQAAMQYSFPQQQGLQSPSSLPPGLNQNSPGAGGILKTEGSRFSIWQGIVEYMEKSINKTTYQLPCTIACNVVNGEPEVSAEQWPKVFTLQLFPRQLLMMPPLCNHLKTNARHITIFFNKDSEGLQNLNKVMTACVGCFQLPARCDIKIIIIVYMPDKKTFMGVIAHDQDNFLSLLRQQHEAYRKQTQQQQQQAVQAKPRMATPPTMAAMAAQPAPQAPAPQGSGPRYPNALSIEAERQQNLLKIQQLQQTLEAAQQKELQYKAAQEQTPFRHLSGPNPQLRHLLQQQQQMRPQQILLSPDMRSQIPAANPQSCWDDPSLIDLLPPNV